MVAGPTVEVVTRAKIYAEPSVSARARGVAPGEVNLPVHGSRGDRARVVNDHAPGRVHRTRVIQEGAAAYSRNGKIIHAATKKCEARDVVMAILGLADGHYRFVTDKEPPSLKCMHSAVHMAMVWAQAQDERSVSREREPAGVDWNPARRRLSPSGSSTIDPGGP